MSDSEVEQEDRTGSVSDQLSNVYDLLSLSIKMFDGRPQDDIIRLAVTFVSSLWGCQFEASYLVDEQDPASGEPVTGEGDGHVRRVDGSWRWVLREPGGRTGYFVISANRPPADEEMVLLKALAQHTSVAIANASSSQRERKHAVEVRRLAEEKAAADTALAAASQRQRAIHEVLMKVSKSRDGEAGIARTLHELTGLPVAVEDRFGNLRAWAGPDEPDPYPKADPRRRSEILRDAAHRGGVIRERNRLFILVQPRSDVIGVLALIDPHRSAGQLEEFALEHSAMALAVELSHRQILAETELRLRRDLVEDLVTGTDDASAYLRAEAIGHDLHGVHHVLVARWTAGATEDDLAQALTRSVTQLELKALVTRRPSGAVALIRGHPPGVALHRVISRHLGTWVGGIGIGGRCERPGEIPRSYAEASRALDIRMRSRAPHGVTSFDDLGVLRILHNENEYEIRTFVKEWLGNLLDYDMRRRTDLVQTLSHYLDCGGNYDETAAALLIHRSTLRYRLQRIRDITGLDLNNVDSRLNLHVATRAWQVLDGSVQPQQPR
jgi:sugar diacid utilization regulator